MADPRELVSRSMAIALSCPACGKRLRAPDHLAGRTLPCPACQAAVVVPAPADEDPEAAAFRLLAQAESEPPRPTPEPVHRESEPEAPAARRVGPPRRVVKSPPPTALADLPPLSADETPAWLKHLHWLLALAMIPLAVSLLRDDANRADLPDRLIATMENAPPESRAKIVQTMIDIEEGRADEDDLFRVLPGRKLTGAFISRFSKIHWGFALISIILFLGFCMLLATDQSAAPLHLLLVGLFTATIGIGLLLLLQTIAALTEGVWVVGGGIGTLIFFFVKLIGFSYQAALDPNSNFFLSLIGFTLGVGLFEELCKLMPVVVRFRHPNSHSWRNAFLWGLASGAGFGIAEGIMYSGSFYNGISGLDTYLVRFTSCVALHALWTGSAAITMHQKQHLLHKEQAWYEHAFPLILYVGVPMLLHGLYDTFLKKEIAIGALVVAALSFAFLAFQIYRLRGEDDAEATKDMLREYKRRRKLMN